MQAVILAGGKGTRLRPLTLNTPKPVLSICNRPFITYHFEFLKRAGIVDIILSLNYQPHKIKRIIGNGKKYGVNLNYVVEPDPRGTAGALKYAEKFIKGTTIVLNGDSIIDFELTKAIRKHQSKKSIATIVLTQVNDPSQFGLVKIDSDGQVQSFSEKQKEQNLSYNTINAGVYLIEPDLLKLIPQHKYTMLEKDIFPSLLKKRIPIHSYTPTKPYWIDIGNPTSFLKANLDFIDNKSTLFTANSIKSELTHIPDVINKKSLVGNGCKIESKVSIVNSVIGDNCIIQEGVSLRNSVIFSNSVISNYSSIYSSVIGNYCRIGKSCSISNSFVGNKSNISDYSFLNELQTR